MYFFETFSVPNILMVDLNIIAEELFVIIVVVKLTDDDVDCRSCYRIN